MNPTQAEDYFTAVIDNAVIGGKDELVFAAFQFRAKLLKPITCV